MDENYLKVAYIGLRNSDGSLMLNVPLYVKVNELNKNGMTVQQEQLIERISEVMLRRYESQIKAFLGQKKGETNGTIQS